MPEFVFSVYCSQCGRGLCNYTKVSNLDVNVDPCPDCLKDARSEGYDNGLRKGLEEKES